MISTTILRRSAVALLAVTSFGVASTQSPVEAQTDCEFCAGGEFFPVSPTRVFDGNVGANSTTFVDVTGDTPAGPSGVPTADVLAVGVNITIDRSRGAGYVAALPSDYVRQPDELITSLLNVNGRGETVPNFGLVGVGA